ncbi:MAG: hypothetical protein NTX03_12510 [Bacteroidetes bacterium]|nr:hypothetical protein [Bacteroidota bacterium]
MSLFFLLLTEKSFAADTLELSKTPIISAKQLDGLCISYLGLKLNISINDAKKTVRNDSTNCLTFEQDKFNNNRFYLYNRKNKYRQAIAYFRWEEHDTGLKEIMIYPAGLELLPQPTQQLFKVEGKDSIIKIIRELGAPAETKTELEIPSLQMKTLRYIYPTQHLMIEENRKKGVSKFSWVLYKN